MNANLGLIRNFSTSGINLSNHYSMFTPMQTSRGERVIEMFKKGHKIHIKKANRGKFTEYCGGKVTSECIARGKNSPDPKIRKRATFAANARKWNK